MKYGNVLSCIIGFLLGLAAVVTYKLALMTNSENLPSVAISPPYIVPIPTAALVEPVVVDVVSVNLTDIIRIEPPSVIVDAEKSLTVNPANASQFPVKADLKPDTHSHPRKQSAVQKSIHIALDFMTSDSAMLTLPNYRSLETMLSIYQDNHFSILIPAPPLSATYKFGNMLSTHQFDKYIKRGYLISNVIFNAAQYEIISSPGSEYWSGKHELSKSLLKQLKQTIPERGGDKRLTYYDATFLRIRHLFQHGGISTDFSLAFSSPVEVSSVGLWHRHFCFLRHAKGATNTKPIKEMIAEHLKSREGLNGVNARVFVPLSSPNWPPSDLTHPYEEPIKDIPVCAYSFIFAVSKQAHPIMSCVLNAYDGKLTSAWTARSNATFLACVERDQYYDSGFDCVNLLFDTCFDYHTIHNEFLTVNKNGTTRALIEDFGFDFKTAGQILYYPPAEIMKSVDSSASWNLERCDRTSNSYWGTLKRKQITNAVWIGPSAHVYDWSDPHPKSVVGRIFDDIYLSKWHPFHLNSSCSTSCHHVVAIKSQGDSEYASHQCTLSFIIPGIMKAATSFLFSSIARHPQILHPVKGFQFKETGAYIDRFVSSVPFKTRFGFFPFIEEQDLNIMTGDGTVFYAVQESAMNRLKTENPNMKAVLVVRNPAIRSYSHWRYLWSNISKHNGTNFNTNTELLLKSQNAFGDILQYIEEGDLEGGLKRYLALQTVHDYSAYIRWSIYVFPYRLLVNKLGKENVMVVSSEELSPFDDKYRLADHRKQTDTLSAVIKFLGLCEMDLAEEIKPKYVNSDTYFPASQKMTKETYELISEYFKPFNQALYNEIGRDLLWERQLFK